MTDMSIRHQPYELLSEHVAHEAMERIRTLGAPEAIMRLLPGILQEVFHDGIETGIGLAEGFETVGPSELAQVYALGIEHGRTTG